MNNDFSQPTQATQTAIEPRGHRTSAFTEEEIADMICLLYPQSAAARREVARIAVESPQYVLSREDADTVAVDLAHEDNACNFTLQRPAEHALILRLSNKLKDPPRGFTFGRNSQRCDIAFKDDPLRRLSNVHSSIYVNEYGVVMIEDTSTNGTLVADELIARQGGPQRVCRTLCTGDRIGLQLHRATPNLVFLVRIPCRNGDYETLYSQNVESYIAYRFGQAESPTAEVQTIVPDQTGRINLFGAQGQVQEQQLPQSTPQPLERRLPNARPKVPQANSRMPRTWDGSGRYNVTGSIGRGAFANVLHVTSKVDGRPFAAKELEKRRFMHNGVLDQKIMNEMNIMRSVKHESIVEFVEHIDWKDRLIIVMEYVPMGDLGRYILDHGFLPEDVVQSTSMQMLNALHHLHSKYITHRDIKPDNILISCCNPFVVKLSDFGLSKMVDDQTFLNTFCGTLLYCAPEVYAEYIEYDENGVRDPRRRKRRNPVTGQRYGNTVDVWSLGGVLFYCLTNKPPFPVSHGTTPTELLHRIMTTDVDVTPLLEMNVSAQAQDFLLGMLNRYPAQRATVQRLALHKWLGGPDQFGFVEIQSDDEIFTDQVTDDLLNKSASQLRIADGPSSANAATEVQGLSDLGSIPEMAERDTPCGAFGSHANLTFGGRPTAIAPRLFGEVGSSMLSKPATESHTGQSYISEGVEAADLSQVDFDMLAEVPNSISGDVFKRRWRSPNASDSTLKPAPKGTPQPSVYSHNQDQNVLDEMEPNRESLSLQCPESILGELNMTSMPRNVIATPSEFTSSKRKPNDQPEDPDTLPLRPKTKRYKSDGCGQALDSGSIKDSVHSIASSVSTNNSREVVHASLLDDLTDEMIALLASLPQAASSRRVMESPIDKSTFWDSSDASTWHLGYPELLSSQYSAFRAGAQKRGEEFAPNRTQIWDIALKYFPPTETPMDKQANVTTDTPSEAVIHPNLIGFCGQMYSQTIVATFESINSSAIPDISLRVSGCFATFGRDRRNTHTYYDVAESCLPKNAFKILLWRPGYDLGLRVPWQMDRHPGIDLSDNEAITADPKAPDSLRYSFYISTKATSGIHVNGVHLRSHGSTRRDSSCKYWIKLYDGDEVCLWKDFSKKTDNHVTVRFRCSWGGSCMPRPTLLAKPELVDPNTAASLDEACHIAERTWRSRCAIQKAEADTSRRRNNMARELERKNAFEEVRIAAVRCQQKRETLTAPKSGGTQPIVGVIAAPPFQEVKSR